jgi:hypothetical protein
MPSKARVVQTTSLDAYCKEHDLSPSFIKIDVEGGEYNILKGAMEVLSTYPVIAVELRSTDYDVLYAPAVTFLEQMGFHAFRIGENGGLSRLHDVAGHILHVTDASDNIIFRKALS